MTSKARRKAVAAVAVAGSVLAGAAAGAALFGPGLAGAQTTTTTPDGQKAFHSNEDPTHEANETPEQEAAEDNGTFRGHRGHGPNEDPAHEANATPEQEAAEHAGRGPAAGSSITPRPSAQNSSVRRS